MIGGGSDDNQPDGQPSPSPPPPSAPPQHTTGGLGRRLLGTIRALLPAPAPPAAAVPKIGLGLLLHLRTDHPLLRPTPSASASPSTSASVSQDAAASQPHPAGAAGTRDGACSDGPPSPLTRYRLVDPAAAAAASAAPPSTVSRQFSDLPKPPPPPAEDNNASFCARALSKELKVKGAADRQGKDLRAAGQGQEDAVQPRPRDEEATSCHNADSSAKDQDDTHPRDIAVDDQDKAVVSATANGTSGGDRNTVKKEKVKLKLPYPQRPGRINCPSYMSKGTCSYGFSCQHHHPQLKAKPDDSRRPSEQGNHGVAASLELNRIAAPIRELKAKPDDNSWRRSEQGNHGVAETLELNRAGLPIREGARNCSHYMRNGACGYGKRCHFNHPEHAIDAHFYAPKGWEEDSALQLEKSSEHHSQRSRLTMKRSSGDATLDDDTSYSKKSSDHATLDDVTSNSKKSSSHATLDDDTSYSKKSSDHGTVDDTSSTTGVLPPNIFRMLLPPQKVAASTAAAMVIPVKKDSTWPSSTSDHSDGCCSADSSDGPLCKQEEHNVDSSDRPFFRKQQEHHHVEDYYPERPGRPDCPFYMKFGDCKFASACNYHHPKDRYPERPGETECPFYMKHRVCKFGAQCRYNHPPKEEDYSNPATAPPQSPIMKARKPVPTGRITLEDHMPRLQQQQQYPERPGQPECRYYMQFGKCKFLSACRFHHPRRDGLPSGRSARSDQEVGPEIVHGMPDCPFYIKSGRCHFGSACEFRHPKDTTAEGASGGHRAGSAYDNSTRPENAAAQQGENAVYPERPGEPECVHYMRHGSCKFQMKCKFHHPAVSPAL